MVFLRSGDKQKKAKTQTAVPSYQSLPVIQHSTEDTRHNSAFARERNKVQRDAVTATLDQKHEQSRDSSPLQSGLWAWIPHVMQSADDATVMNRVLDVFTSAEQFVNNFYTDQNQETDGANQSLERLARASQFTSSQLQYYLKNVDFKTILIKHMLISLLLDLISFQSTTSKGALLPKEFRNFNLIAKGSLKSTSENPGISHVQPALCSYRVLTAYIRSDISSDARYLEKQHKVIEDVIATFEAAFLCWARKERDSESRTAALRRILEKTGALGIFLFSQPSVFHFHWGVPAQDLSEHKIPIWPRLLKVIDDEAQLKDFAQCMLHMKQASLFREARVVPKEIAEGEDFDAHSLVRPNAHNHLPIQHYSNTAPLKNIHGLSDTYREEAVSPQSFDLGHTSPLSRQHHSRVIDSNAKSTASQRPISNDRSWTPQSRDTVSQSRQHEHRATYSAVLMPGSKILEQTSGRQDADLELYFRQHNLRASFQGQNNVSYGLSNPNSELWQGSALQQSDSLSSVPRLEFSYQDSRLHGHYVSGSPRLEQYSRKYGGSF